MIRFILLGIWLTLLAACAVTFPANYTPQSFVKLGEEQVRFGSFAYVPAVQGEIKSNEVLTASITPHTYLKEDVADFIMRSTKLEFERAGLTVADSANIEISGQILELSFIDSIFGTTWKCRVNYTVREVDSGKLLLNHIYESAKGGGVFTVSSGAMSDVVSETIEKLVADLIDRKVFSLHSDGAS